MDAIKDFFTSMWNNIPEVFPGVLLAAAWCIPLACFTLVICSL